MICGPTAAGKSAVALALAEQAGGTVINADSMQLYSDLRVVTARPGADDEARAPHSLYGVVDGSERASVASWLDLAATAVDAARKAGSLPIVVGGTGMYLQAAREGIAPIPEFRRRFIRPVLMSCRRRWWRPLRRLRARPGNGGKVI